MADRQWKDLKDVQIGENVLPNLFGSFMLFSFVDPKAEVIFVAGVDPVNASKIYRFSQSQEQAWEEKRRIRDIKEKRAAAGGGQFPWIPN